MYVRQPGCRGCAESLVYVSPSLRVHKTFPWGLPLQMCDTPEGSLCGGNTRATPCAKALPAFGKTSCEPYAYKDFGLLDGHLLCTGRRARGNRGVSVLQHLTLRILQFSEVALSRHHFCSQKQTSQVSTLLSRGGGRQGYPQKGQPGDSPCVRKGPDVYISSSLCISRVYVMDSNKHDQNYF